MNITETTQVLRTLGAAYGRRIDEDMIRTWTDSLGQVSASLAADCALDWAENEPNFPSLNAFLTNCQHEARHRALVNQRDRALPPAPMPDDVRRIRDVEQARRSKAQVGLLAEIIKSHKDDEPMDDETILAIVQADRLTPLDDDGPRLCRCGGGGVVYCDARGNEDPAGAWARPCEQCNETAFTLWRGGHFAVGHRCDVCRPHRRRTER